LFLEGDQVCFGVARGLEGHDQAELEEFVTTLSRLAPQFEANLREGFDPRWHV
jgi:hypothetical protein